MGEQDLFFLFPQSAFPRKSYIISKGYLHFSKVFWSLNVRFLFDHTNVYV